jgi:hypothetical protein
LCRECPEHCAESVLSIVSRVSCVQCARAPRGHVHATGDTAVAVAWQCHRPHLSCDNWLLGVQCFSHFPIPTSITINDQRLRWSRRGAGAEQAWGTADPPAVAQPLFAAPRPFPSRRCCCRVAAHSPCWSLSLLSCRCPTILSIPPIPLRRLPLAVLFSSLCSRSCSRSRSLAPCAARHLDRLVRG